MKELKRSYMMNWLKEIMPLILAEMLKKKDYNAKIKDIEDT